MTSIRALLTVVASLVCGLVCGARAADTVETWDVGATDVDFYLGADGLGPDADARSMFGDIMLGYGLIDRLSAYVGATLSADGHFAHGNAGLYLGVFGTPIETDHFDLDLFLDVSAGGDGFDAFAFTPSTEINFDLDPDQGSWGLYVRAGVPIYGEAREAVPERHVHAFDVEVNPGTYVTLGRGHQLLFEYDMLFHSQHDKHTSHVGGLAVGYNVVLAESIELINQVYFDIPQRDEQPAIGLFTGIIVTLPSMKRDRVAQLVSR